MKETEMEGTCTNHRRKINRDYITLIKKPQQNRLGKNIKNIYVYLRLSLKGYFDCMSETMA
jgi:hypothetical protein